VRAEKASGGGFSEHLEEIPPRLARPPIAEVLGVFKSVGTPAGRGKGMEAGVPEAMRNLARLRLFHTVPYWHKPVVLGFAQTRSGNGAVTLPCQPVYSVLYSC
jgi:hypothetical protein